MNAKLIEAIAGGLIVSCQAYEHDPLYGSDMMARLAVAATVGGAVGIRANSPPDIAAIRQVSALPLIGLWKQHYPDSDVYITPTMAEAAAVAEAGADIIALDATARYRPGGAKLGSIVAKLRQRYPHCLLLADIATVAEGEQAQALGFDLISTTLSGYTADSPQQQEPDFQLVRQLADRVAIPVLAEGRITQPEQAARVLQLGASAVVIGAAITRPEEITKRFVSGLTAAVVAER